ncbi:unnamed protein product [Prunus armeniaca]
MIEKNSTWELVDRPSNKPIVGVKWVYKTKLNLDRSIQKHKARLVAKRYTQKPGFDFVGDEEEDDEGEDPRYVRAFGLDPRRGGRMPEADGRKD